MDDHRGSIRRECGEEKAIITLQSKVWWMIVAIVWWRFGQFNEPVVARRSDSNVREVPWQSLAYTWRYTRRNREVISELSDSYFSKKRRSFCVCCLGISCWKIEKLRRFIQGCIPAQVLWDFKKTSVANWSTALPPHLTWIACQWVTCWYLSWATLLLVEWGAGVPIMSEVSVRIRTY